MLKGGFAFTAQRSVRKMRLLLVLVDKSASFAYNCSFVSHLKYPHITARRADQINRSFYFSTVFFFVFLKFLDEQLLMT